jgi:hypothetical protein
MEDNISRRKLLINGTQLNLLCNSPIELKRMFNILNANSAWQNSTPACLVILLVTFKVSNDRFDFSSYGKNWFGLGLSFGF